MTTLPHPRSGRARGEDKGSKEEKEEEYIEYNIYNFDENNLEIIDNPENPQITKLKNKLNKYKNKLDIYDSKAFNINSNNYNKYSKLRAFLQQKYNAQYVSNAWLKMYEVLCKYNLLTDIEHPVVFCNAELPGGFIFAINHYLSIRNKSYKWYASSLAPVKGESQLADKFGLFAKYPDNWLMSPSHLSAGKDESEKGDGDTANVKNLMYFQSVIGNQIDLYTADAGIDTSDDPNNQELLNMHIHFGEFIAGLMTLKKGGTSFIKYYTFFEMFSISVLQLYSKYFEQVKLIKPKTSKILNSETYILALGFKGIENEDIEFLLNALDFIKKKENKGNISICRLNNIFVERHIKIIDELIYKQIYHIQKFMEIFNKIDINYKMFNKRWINENPIEKIKDENKL